MTDLETRLAECLERLAPDTPSPPTSPVPSFSVVQGRARRLHRRDLARRSLVAVAIAGVIGAFMAATNRPPQIVAAGGSDRAPQRVPDSTTALVTTQTASTTSSAAASVPVAASLPVTSGWRPIDLSTGADGAIFVSYQFGLDTLSLYTIPGTSVERVAVGSEPHQVSVNGARAITYGLCAACDGPYARMLSWQATPTTVATIASNLGNDQMMLLAAQVRIVPLSSLASALSSDGVPVKLEPSSPSSEAGPPTTEATIDAARLTAPYLTPLGEPDEQADADHRSAFRLDPPPADLASISDVETVNAQSKRGPARLRFGLFTGWDTGRDPARFVRSMPVWVISRATGGGLMCGGCPIEKGYSVEVRVDGDLGRLLALGTFLGNGTSAPT